MHDLAKSLDDRELELRAHLYRLAARLQLGDIQGVDADLAAVDRLAHRAAPAAVAMERAPGSRDAGHHRRPLRRGRASCAERAAALGDRAEEPVAAQFHATQIALLRRLRRSPEDDAELDGDRSAS